MKNLYLALAVLGTVLPYWFFAQHFAEAGLSLPAFLGQAFANPVAAGLSADIVVSSVVFWVLLTVNGDGARIWTWFLVPLNLAVGLSCALPLYLYLRCRDRESASGSAAGVVG